MKNYVKAGLLGLLLLVFASCDKEKDKGKQGESFTETAFGVNFEMVYVQGGTFQMGATAEQGDEVDSDERPVRSVKLDSYYIGKYEVTQAQWEAVMGTNPSYFTGDSLPVEMVNWLEAEEFCEKLSARTGKKYVLPTEAQWEYAARGGKESKGYRYAGGNDIEEVAWCEENSGRRSHAVGMKKANELGIYDMSGNVVEWCADWYGGYDEADTDNPAGPTDGENRVARGGSWVFDAESCRVSFRAYNFPYVSGGFLGFRIAMIP